MSSSSTLEERLNRLERALQRSEFWQCKCCEEYYPKNTERPLGLCESCFIDSFATAGACIDENLPLHDMAVTLRIYQQHCFSFLCGQYHAHRSQLTKPPKPWLVLVGMIHALGEKKILEALAVQGIVGRWMRWDQLIWDNTYGLRPRKMPIPDTPPEPPQTKWRLKASEILQPFWIPVPR